MMPPFPRNLESGLASTLDLVAAQVRAVAEQISRAFPQVRVLDVYNLSAVSLHGEGAASVVAGPAVDHSRYTLCGC